MLNPSKSTTSAAGPRRVLPHEARAASQSGHALLVDVRDARLFDNAHLDPAVSLPLAEIEAAGRRLPASISVPEGALLILYCA